MNKPLHSIDGLMAAPLKLGRGARAQPLAVSYSHDITAEELARAASTPTSGSAVILSIRQSHHQVARLLAQKVRPVEICAMIGFSQSRISVLKGDPQFKELLAYYESMEADHYEQSRADMHQRLAAIGFDSLEVLHERLLDEPDRFDNKTLLAVVEAASDRTGYGKTSTVNHDHAHALSDATIAKIKEATQAGRPLSEADRGTLLCLASERTAELHPDEQEADWVEGGGTELRAEGGEGTEEPLPSGELDLSSVARVVGPERDS